MKFEHSVLRYFRREVCRESQGTLRNAKQKHPDKVFLYFGKQKVTYKEFDENMNKAANVFLDLVIKKGDRVCFFP